MRKALTGIRYWAMTIALLIYLVGISNKAHAKAPSEKLKIGVMKSIFRDLPTSWIKFISRPLKSLIEAETGMDGEIILIEDEKDMAAKLNSATIDIGVMHGVEFAWSRAINARLRPIVTSARKNLEPCRAALLVRKDSEITKVGELKGKKVALAKRSKAHCHLFLERRCPDPATNSKEFFKAIEQPASPSTAMDQVVSKQIDAAIIDNLDLIDYGRSKRGLRNQLRVLQQSMTFPDGVVAYQSDKLTANTVNKIRLGLLHASKTARGRQMLQLCKIASFQEVKDDYEDQLKEILRAYPPTVEEEE